jgi:hypothetical protein
VPPFSRDVLPTLRERLDQVRDGLPQSLWRHAQEQSQETGVFPRYNGSHVRPLLLVQKNVVCAQAW